MKLNDLLKVEKTNFTNTYNKSYFIYKYSLIIFVIPIFVSIFFELKYINYVLYPLSALLLIAFLIDLFFIIKLLWGKTYGKILYSIIGYFAFIKATVYAKNIIYFNTGVNPDIFQSSINYIAGWLLVPVWIIQMSSWLSIIVIFLYILQFIIMISKDYIKITELKILEPIKKYVGVNIGVHITFFIIGFITFTSYAKDISYQIYNHSYYNVVKEEIKKNSYYPNNYIICKNPKILLHDYIKLIGDDVVSIARTNAKGDITFYRVKCN